MSNLITIPKNGRPQKRNSEFNAFPSLSWFDDIIGNDLSSGFIGNIKTGMPLPAVNIKEHAEAHVIEIAIPGMKKSDFNVDLDNKVLTISAEVEETKESREESYTRREFGYSSFKRSFTLPDTVETNNISATYKEGILNVVIPKREEAKQKPVRTIKIS